MDPDLLEQGFHLLLGPLVGIVHEHGVGDPAQRQQRHHDQWYEQQQYLGL